MPPKAPPSATATKAKPAAPLTKAQINKMKKDEAQKLAAMDNAMRNLSLGIGNDEVSIEKAKTEASKLEDQVQTDLNKSVQVVSSITNLHISTQRDYEQRISRLNEKIAELRAQLAQEKEKLAALKKEKKQVLFEKDSVIENQKREMKEMAYQFSDMLMKTLITITEDFEAQTGEFGREETAGLPQPERLKDFHLDRIRV